jgi:hypothetical protein
MSDFPIRQVRIDIPLRTSVAYFFVDADDAKWDPWWGLLYEYLLRHAPPDADWQHEPVQDKFFARSALTTEEKLDLLNFLKGAPKAQIESHRTLRLAIKLTQEKAMKLQLMFFSG